jgi:NCS1 family nucleobase:cation symporter-1
MVEHEKAMAEDALHREARRLSIEVRSIDYIPERERRGSARHLGAVWFVGNAELVSMATGPIGISLGLNFAWTAVALVLGAAIGVSGMALHSAQGPKLGLSQMIQSRAQFGVLGSLVPVLVALFIFVGYSVFDTYLGGEVLNSTINTGLEISYVIFIAVAVLLAIAGYHLIHRASRYASWIYILCFGFFTVLALIYVDLPSEQFSLSSSQFQLGPFLIVLGALIGYNLTWSPYVSDYSRYLPKETSVSSAFWYTYVGATVGSIWPAVMGAYVSAAYPDESTTGLIEVVSDQFFEGWGDIALLLLLPTLIIATTMSLYTATLTLLSGLDVVVSEVRAHIWRVIFALVIALVVVIIALTLPKDFTGNYTAFLTICLYFMVPWTAINLVDFFLIRKGNYAIIDIFSLRGIYGLWGVRGLIAYAVGFAVMIPFFSTTLYTGAIAERLGGGDIAPFIGFPVASIVYYVLARNIDVASEAALAREQLIELNAKGG